MQLKLQRNYILSRSGHYTQTWHNSHSQFSEQYSQQFTRGYLLKRASLWHIVTKVTSVAPQACLYVHMIRVLKFCSSVLACSSNLFKDSATEIWPLYALGHVPLISLLFYWRFNNLKRHHAVHFNILSLLH